MMKRQYSFSRGFVKRIFALLLCVVMICAAVGPYHAKADATNRYIILIVDTSGSSDFIDTTTGEVIFTAKSPLDEVKQAADRFTDALDLVRGTQVAIVSYGRYAHLEQGFSDDIDTIKTNINNLSMIGGRKNLSDALKTANELLSSIADVDAMKSIVLVSSGMTDEGEND